MDSVGEEDVRAWFPCPFCYVEIEVPMLCSHLQDEHCFNFKNAVCPICAATLGKDPMGHFAVQHAQSVKRRRKHLKSGFWENPTAMIGYKGLEPVTDPLLSPFLCNVPTYYYDSKSRQDDTSSVCDTAAEVMQSCTSKLLVSDPAMEEDVKRKMQRASFLQELVASTIY